MVRPARLGKRVRDGLLAIVGLAAVGYAVFLAVDRLWERPVGLTMTAGHVDGGRFQIALALKHEAARHQIGITLQETAGSVAALEALDSGLVDAALVQGGLGMGDHPNLRQIAVLYDEPLHLLVKREIPLHDGRSLKALDHKKVNLGELGSGTSVIAGEVMEFSRRRADFEYTGTNLSYDELKETDRSNLPDAVFCVSIVPARIVEHLVRERDYRLVSLPILDAFVLGSVDEGDAQHGSAGAPATRIDRRFVCEAKIPALCYDIEPGDSPEPIRTLGTRMLLVARQGLASATVRRLLEVVYNSPFSGHRRPALDASLLESPPELTWHDATKEYSRRNSPLIAGDVIDPIEKYFSILSVLIGGLFCLWQWVRRRYRWRRERSFEAYILQVARVESRALDVSKSPTLDLAALLQFQDDLTRIKVEALERYAAGELDSEELMSGFLVHASDVRDFLARLILHQRDNLEDAARAQRRPAEALWKEAVGDAAGLVTDWRIVEE